MFSCSVKLQHVYVLTNETGEKPSCLQSSAVHICHSWWRCFESFQNHHGISSMVPVPPRSLLKCVAHSSYYTMQTERSSDCHHCHAAALCSVIFSPHISELKIPLTKPYKNLCPRRQQTVEYQSAPGAAFERQDSAETELRYLKDNQEA